MFNLSYLRLALALMLLSTVLVDFSAASLMTTRQWDSTDEQVFSACLNGSSGNGASANHAFPTPTEKTPAQILVAKQHGDSLSGTSPVSLVGGTGGSCILAVCLNFDFNADWSGWLYVSESLHWPIPPPRSLLKVPIQVGIVVG